MASSAACTFSTVAWRKIAARGGQSAQEAVPCALVDTDRVRRAIGVALQPHGQRLVIGPRVGMERRPPVDLGAENFGGRRRDDLKLRSCHLVTRCFR